MNQQKPFHTPKKSENKWWERYGEIGTLMHYYWEYKMVHCLKKKKKIELPHDPATSPETYPKELNIGPQRDIYTLMAHSSTIAKK